jgi:YcxB-like protein
MSAQQQSMEVTYQLTPDDLYAFQWRAAYLSAKSRRARRVSYLYLFLPFLVIALLPMIGSSRSLTAAKISAVMLIVVFPIVAVCYALMYRRLIRRAILKLVAEEKPDKGHLGWHTVVIDDEGLVETTAVGQSRSSWAGVDRIEHDADYIFIYTAPAQAHTIPKRAFTQSTANDFFEFARRRHAQAAAV